MKRLQVCVFALSLCLFLLVLTAPATLLDAELDQLSQGRLRLVQAEGTVWSGHGQLEIRDATGAAVLHRSVSWQLERKQLLLLRLSARFSLTGQQQPSRITASLSSIVITDLDVTAPAAAVAQLVPAVTGYGVGGELQLSSEQLVFKRTAIEGSLLLQWISASSELAPLEPLGSYVLNLDGTAVPGQFAFTLQTLQGPLQLDGNGSLGSNQNNYTVTARLPEAEYSILAPFLRLIAVEAADHSFVLKR